MSQTVESFLEFYEDMIVILQMLFNVVSPPEIVITPTQELAGSSTIIASVWGWSLLRMIFNIT